MRRREELGFSLIELLIVVAIILIIMAIAIPNLLHSQIAAHQVSAIGSLRAINAAEITYSSTYSTGFSPTLAALGPPTSGTGSAPSAANLIDSVLASGTKSGYVFTYTPGSPDASGRINTYTVSAAPVSPGITGGNYYFTDPSTTVRLNTSATATASDPPLNQ